MGNLLDLRWQRSEKARCQRNRPIPSQHYVANAIVRYLVNITPVDTSQALSNWQAGDGTPKSSSISAYFVGFAGSTQGASAQEAMEVAAQVIALAKPGEPIYLSNVLPYIKRLDEGSSSQHPGGFVHASVIVGKLSLRDFNYDWNK
ncbi:hypothetical protein P9A30_gp13 [Sphingomonas phage Lucius]|uniref:Uncharacterized protein n=1 Tax=Sphingomonas phage Lucius TaxID=2686313 RepID=A0A6M3TCI3_9CAUD|nr:hypothetical protein P9A30_gp13 [Sphingomonas phage Lucius]QJD54455.1 hypothetical protein [Sphingomonas phage Lucius]